MQVKSNYTPSPYKSGPYCAADRYAYEREIHDYAAEEERKGIKIDVSRERLNIPLVAHVVVKIKVALFIMSDGVGVVALDTANVDKLFPKNQVQSLTRVFVEVGCCVFYRDRIWS